MTSHWWTVFIFSCTTRKLFDPPNFKQGSLQNHTMSSTPVKLESHSGIDVLNNQSRARKLVLLLVLCFALFLDTFNNSSLFAAIPPIALQLKITNSQSVWLLSAYQLTFAALLLIVGIIYLKE